ncbi:hypothetical protein ACFLXX_03915 [Chloroflexota bacterium]
MPAVSLDAAERFLPSSRDFLLLTLMAVNGLDIITNAGNHQSARQKTAV